MPPVPASDDAAITRAEGVETFARRVSEARDGTLQINASLNENETPTLLYLNEMDDEGDDRHSQDDYIDFNDIGGGDDDNDDDHDQGDVNSGEGGDGGDGNEGAAETEEIGDPTMAVTTLSDSAQMENEESDDVLFSPTHVELNRNGVVSITLTAEVTGNQSALLRLLRRDATSALNSLKAQDTRGGAPEITFATPPPMERSSSSPSSLYPKSKYRNEPPWCALLAGNAGAVVSLTSVNGDELSGKLLGVEPPSRARGGDGFVFLEDETGAAVAIRPLDAAPIRISPNPNLSSATATVAATLPHAVSDADPYFTIRVRGHNNDTTDDSTNNEDVTDMGHGLLSVTYNSFSEFNPAFDIVYSVNLSRESSDDGVEDHAKLSASVTVPNPTPFPLKNVELALITGDAIEQDDVDNGGSATTSVARVPGADLEPWSSSESSSTSQQRSYSSDSNSSDSSSSRSTRAPSSHYTKCALDDNALEIPLADTTDLRQVISADRFSPTRRRIIFPQNISVDVNQSTILPLMEDVRCTVGLSHFVVLECDSSNDGQTARRTLWLRNTTGAPLEAGVGRVLFLDGQVRRFKMPFMCVGAESGFTLSYESAVTVTSRSSTRVADVVSCTMRVDRLVTCVEWIHHVRFDVFNANSRPVDVVVRVHLAKTEGLDSGLIGGGAIVAFSYDHPRDIGRDGARTRLLEVGMPCRNGNFPAYRMHVGAKQTLSGTIDEKAVREHTFDIRSNDVSPRLIAQLARLDGVPLEVPNRLRRLVRERQALKALRRTRRRHCKKLRWFAGFVEGKIDEYWTPDNDTVNGQHFLDTELDRYVTLSDKSERCVARLRERINELDERIVAAEHDVRDVVDQLTRLLTDEAQLIVDEGRTISGTASSATPGSSANTNNT